MRKGHVAAGAGIVVLVVVVGAVMALQGGAGNVPVHQVGAGEFVRRVTAEGTLRAVKSTPINAPPRARSALKIATILENGTLVDKDDILVTFDPTDFENELYQGEALWDTSGNKLDRQDVLSAAVQHNLSLDARMAQEEYESATQFAAKDVTVFSRMDVIEADIDQDLALKRRDSTDRVKEVRKDQAGADRELIEIEQRKAKIKIDQARDGLEALTIRAPHDGIFVLKANPWSGDVPVVGQTVWRGFPVGELPDLSAMEAEIFVLEADAGGLAEGIEASLVIESSPGRTYKGKIKSVEPLAKPRTRGVPVQYFSAVVELEETDAATMKPGARVRATLTLEKLGSAITVPRQAIFEHKGKPVVYRRDGSGFTPVPVEVGNATPGNVIITKGLAAGDVIALSNPEANGNGGDR
jgi:RND family efflux transporter MFP subunit